MPLSCGIINPQSEVQNPETETNDNDTLARWREALIKVQEASERSVFGETLAARTELLNITDEIICLAEESQAG
jgi:hypothetical protein